MHSGSWGSVLLKLIHPVCLCHRQIRSPGGSLGFKLHVLFAPPPPSQCILHCFPAEQPRPQLLPPHELPFEGKSAPCPPSSNIQVYQLQQIATPASCVTDMTVLLLCLAGQQ
jgi:hypothetical protein